MNGDRRNPGQNGLPDGSSAGGAEAPGLLQRAALLYQQGNYPEALKLVTFYQARHGQDVESDLLLFKVRKKIDKPAAPPSPAPPPRAPTRVAAVDPQELNREQVLGKIRKHVGLGSHGRAAYYVQMFEARFGSDPDVDRFRLQLERQAGTAEPPAEPEAAEADPEGVLVLESLLPGTAEPAGGDIDANAFTDLFSLDESDLHPDAQPAASHVKPAAPPRPARAQAAAGMEWPDEAPASSPPPPPPPAPATAPLSTAADDDMFDLAAPELPGIPPDLQLQVDIDEEAFQLQVTPLLSEAPQLPEKEDVIALGPDTLAIETGSEGEAVPVEAEPLRTDPDVRGLLEWPEESSPAAAPASGEAAQALPSNEFGGGAMLEWPEEAAGPLPTPAPAAPATPVPPASKPGLEGLPLYYPPAQPEAGFKVTGVAPAAQGTLYQPAAPDAGQPAVLPPTQPFQTREAPPRRRARLWPFLGLAVVAAGAGTYFFLSSRSRPAAPEPPARVPAAAPVSTAPAVGARERRHKALLAGARQDMAASRWAEAQKKLLQAKDIRVSTEVLELERQWKERKEAAARPVAVTPVAPPPVPVDSAQLDEQTFQRAQELKSTEGYREYLSQFPWGAHRQEATRALSALETQARIDLLQQLEQRATREQRVRLPVEFRDLEPASAQAALARAPAASGARLEPLTIDGDIVLADFTTGLMWHLWDNPMDFDKSQMWSIRRWAGFANWRMPTIEEAASLAVILRGDARSLMPSSIEVWTGDRDAKARHSRWVLRLLDLATRTVPREEPMHLCAVRSMRR